MALIKGNDRDNDLDGTSSNDSIYGFAGDDFITGGAGNDFISGGADNDDIVGGSGINNLNGGSGNDWFIMSRRETKLSDDFIEDFDFNDDRIDLVDWGVSDISQIEAIIDSDQGDAVFNAFYNGVNHHLTIADVDPDDLVSSDFVFTTAGAKDIEGTSRADVLFGSVKSDLIDGNGGSDIVLGGKGNDRLFGGAGDDDLHGGAGADTMTGDSGDDVFVYASTSESNTSTRDFITDFTPDVDLIDLSDIDARTTRSGNQEFDWIGSSSYSSSGQLRYSYDGGDTIISGNTDTDTSSEFSLRIDGRFKPIDDDFIL